MKNFLIILIMSLAVVSAYNCGGAASSPPADIPVALEGVEGSSDVAVNSSFSYEFDQAVTASTVNTSTFFIVPTPTSSNLATPVKAEYDDTICDVDNALESSVSCDSVTECTLDPTNDLSTGTSYTACVSPSIEYAASWSIFIRNAYAEGNFEGVSFTFTTTGEAAIPDVSGVYTSDNTECMSNSTFTESSTENIYSFCEFCTLTMTGSTTCTIAIDIEDEDVAIGCSYTDEQFTMSMTSPNTCTAVLTRSTAVCGDGICEYEKGETAEACPSDCGIEISSISFLADHTWSTTSPENDCLSAGSGTSDFSFDNEPDDDALDSYIASLGDLYLRINYTESGYCLVRLNNYDDDYLTDDCAYISSCNTNGVSAVCELSAGGYCNIDLE
ncbi:MAG: hypothetical protein HN337_04010 [Deltaproteobacteria bacterium]|jgi:hypothetical protein|nr:hypothetical protein [Deltaproteobacteria bacterium]